MPPSHKPSIDIEEWHWPYNVTTQTVQPREMHMYTKYQTSIYIGSNVMANVK